MLLSVEEAQQLQRGAGVGVGAGPAAIAAAVQGTREGGGKEGTGKGTKEEEEDESWHGRLLQRLLAQTATHDNVRASHRGAFPALALMLPRVDAGALMRTSPAHPLRFVSCVSMNSQTRTKFRFYFELLA